MIRIVILVIVIHLAIYAHYTHQPWQNWAYLVCGGAGVVSIIIYILQCLCKLKGANK